MTEKYKIVSINKSGHLFDDQGKPITPPSHWSFLPAGDAGITRKVTAKGEYWRVEFKKGRRTMSKGVWAPTPIIDAAQKEMTATRSTDAYQKKKEYSAKYREKQQQEYEVEFCNEVESFLNFHPNYKVIAKVMAILVTQHAIPVGSGTVARTAMIPVQERAARAVIAWMRHQTTSYDHMNIARIKGERKEVRKMLAQESTRILTNYRHGLPIPFNCPLKKALDKILQQKSIFTS